MTDITFEEWADLLKACNMAELEGGSGAYSVLDKLRAHHGLPPLYRGMLRAVNVWELADKDDSRLLATCPKGHEHVMDANLFVPQVEGSVAILDNCPCEAAWVVHLPDPAGHPRRTACGQFGNELILRRPNEGGGGPYLGRNARGYTLEKEDVSCTECWKTISSPSTTPA